MFLPYASIIALRGQMIFRLTKWINRSVVLQNAAPPSTTQTDLGFWRWGQTIEKWFYMKNWVEFRVYVDREREGMEEERESAGCEEVDSWGAWVVRREDQQKKWTLPSWWKDWPGNFWKQHPLVVLLYWKYYYKYKMLKCIHIWKP